MSIIEMLSSQVGERNSGPNQQAADRCLADPALLGEVAAGLASEKPDLQADCAEVLTMAAGRNPRLVAPHADALLPLLTHRTTRARWEAMHALALVAALRPELLDANLACLRAIIGRDRSIIVRDYATDAVAAYAGTGRAAAEHALPVLMETLALWEGRHAKQALQGLALAAGQLPERRAELARLAEPFLQHKKKVVAQAARRLQRMGA